MASRVNGKDKTEITEIDVSKAGHPYIPSWFLKKFLSQVKGAALAVLIAYMSRADTDGWAFPSVGCLCKDTSYGRKAVKAGRKQLVDLGILIPGRQERKGGQYGKKYFRLAWKAIPSQPQVDESETEHDLTEVPSTVVPQRGYRKGASNVFQFNNDYDFEI